MAIGFKNRTDGNKEIAINAMLASQENHSFLGVDNNGQASIVNTLGNKNTCIVLRGDCVNGCNFDIDNLNLTKEYKCVLWMYHMIIHYLKIKKIIRNK